MVDKPAVRLKSAPDSSSVCQRASPHHAVAVTTGGARRRRGRPHRQRCARRLRRRCDRHGRPGAAAAPQPDRQPARRGDLRALLQQGAGDASGQRQVGLQERDRGAGRHRHRPQADRRRAHAVDDLLSGAGQGRRPAQASDHGRGSARDALGARGDQRPRVRRLGDQRQLGAIRAEPADDGRPGRGHGLQHRQHPPAVGHPHQGHRR